MNAYNSELTVNSCTDKEPSPGKLNFRESRVNLIFECQLSLEFFQKLHPNKGYELLKEAILVAINNFELKQKL